VFSGRRSYKKGIRKSLKTRGIWDETKETEQDEIVKSLQDIEKKLYLGDNKKKATLQEGKDMAIEMRKLRIKLRELISERMAMEENTAEALADNAKFDYFVADCTYYENGLKVYKDVEDYNSKSSDEIAFSAASELASMIYQMDSKFEETLPENKWLKTFNLVNEELSLIDKDGNLVDTKGRKINEKGHYLDEKGNRVDVDGNLLNEDGTYVIQAEYEGVEEPAPKTTKKKSTTESKAVEESV